MTAAKVNEFHARTTEWQQEIHRIRQATNNRFNRENTRELKALYDKINTVRFQLFFA